MTTLEVGGYFSRDTEIEKYIATNNDAYNNREYIKKLIVEVLEIIKALNLPEDTIWYRKSNFFTLVVELCKQKVFNPMNVKTRLISFEEDILSNKNEPKEFNEFSLYYAYMYTGTNSRQARVVRSEIFEKNVLK